MRRARKSSFAKNQAESEVMTVAEQANEARARARAQNMAVPVIAATLTTLAAFAPLLFWPGMVGEFMGYLPITLIVTLSSSLFMALVIIPTLCSMFMKVGDEEKVRMRPAARWTLVGVGALFLLVTASRNPLTAVLLVLTALFAWGLYRFVLDRTARHFQEIIVPLNLRWYERSLRWALNHRLVVIAGSGAALVLTMMVFGRFNAGIEYFPEDIPPKQVWVDVEMPAGTRADATDQIARRLEGEMTGVPGRTDWESVVAMTGSGGSGGASSMMGQGGPGGPDASRLAVTLIDFQNREFDAFETLAWMQENVGTQIAGGEVTVEQMQEGPATGPPVSIEIVGEDPDVLGRLSDRAIEILENSSVYPKLVGLESDLDQGRPELSVSVDRERAALYDLSTADVGMAIRGAINGIEAGKYRTGNDEYDIIVRLAPEYRHELENLREPSVMADGGRQIPLLSVASWEVGEGYGSIRRKDQKRMATLTADVAAGLNSNAVLFEVQAALAEFAEVELSPGYEVQYTGQNQDQAEAQAFLGGAFLTALLLIGFILVSQFNSVVKPFIILTSVLMSTVGVLLGLMIFRMPFGIIMTGVGVISLAGIVVNNAIVLIDYVDILRTRDALSRREALVQGGKTRFRPVVLTAMTTALGLVPLAIGLNFDFFGLYESLNPELFWGGDQAAWWGPMAIAVIAGILFATFLTLVLVPVLYSLIDDIVDFFAKHFTNAGRPGDRSKTPERVPEEAPADSPPLEPEPVGAFRRRLPLGGASLRPQAE